MSPPLALYVHLPWCVRKCPYCDFNSHAVPGGGVPEDAIPARAARRPRVRGRGLPGPAARLGVLRRRNAESVLAVVDRASSVARYGIVADDARARDHAGGEPRHHRARRIRRISRGRHQPRVARRSELRRPAPRGARSHTCGGGNPRGGIRVARRRARQLQPGSHVRPAGTGCRAGACRHRRRARARTLRTCRTTSSRSSRARCSRAARRRCPARTRASICRAPARPAWPRPDTSSTRFRPMHAPARNAGTTGITGSSATTSASAPGRTARSPATVASPVRRVTARPRAT